MKKLNKKEIKALKRDVARYGADYQGYYYSIDEVISYIVPACAGEYIII